jgi:large subunit ribosomal protein L32
MPVPKRKRSRSRRDKRFANKAISIQALTKCKNCDESIMPHSVCRACGYYKGIKILKTKQERLLTRAETRKAKDVAPEPTPQETSSE